MDQRAVPVPSEVRAQVERLQSSSKFARSVRLLEFLRFIVEESLNGRGDSLKEAAIGNAIYGREPPYDPQIDSTVRVEAARLRRKLKEYYASEGRSDPVTISLPAGGYAPEFMANPSDASPPPREAPAADMDHRGAEKFGGTSITSMPIRNCEDVRSDVGRARALVLNLLTELELETGGAEVFRRLGEYMAAPNENGIEKLNDAYREAISLPSRVGSTKGLTEALKTLVALEREAYGISNQAGSEATDYEASLRALTFGPLDRSD